MIDKPARTARIIAIGFAGLSLALAAVAAEVAPTSSLPPTVAQSAAGVDSSSLTKLTPTALDAFVGYYKADDHSVMVVTRESDHLNVQSSGEPKADAVYPEGASRFFYAEMNIDAKIEFEISAEGQTTAAVLLQNGGRLIMPRIDAVSAQRIETARLSKVQTQTPSAGSMDALRHFIDGILSGHPDLDKLGPPLAGQVAKDLPKLRTNEVPRLCLHPIRPPGGGGTMSTVRTDYWSDATKGTAGGPCVLDNSCTRPISPFGSVPRP